jgi:hypothetical protein
MATIPYTCVAPVDDDAEARRRALQQRMRVASIVGTVALAGLVACVIHAYLASGVLTAIGLLFIGGLFLFEAFRQADQRFIAPLQARCQDDYNRQVEMLLGPLFASRENRAAERADA